MATLYMVGVPIGNLEDITFRAIRTLKEVAFIACEDTRHSQRLLGHYDIHKPLLSCHSHNEARALEGIVSRLNEGQDGAYISDADTPGISDPGGRLVEAAVNAGHVVCPIPGPSALSTILSVLGLPGKSYLFEGFLSPKSGRRKNQLKSLMERGDIAIVYESPFRILGLLADIHEVAPSALVVLGRELTKIHEEILRGPAGELHGTLSARPAVKGEFVVAISQQKLLREDSDGT